jgi:hypothetical protein
MVRCETTTCVTIERAFDNLSHTAMFIQASARASKNFLVLQHCCQLLCSGIGGIAAAVVLQDPAV